MKPNHIRPPSILLIIPRLIIILIIRFKPSNQSNPFITVCPIDLNRVADMIVFSAEVSATVFYYIGFVARGGTGDRGLVFNAVGPGPFGLRVVF